MGNRDPAVTEPDAPARGLDSSRMLDLLERHEELDRQILTGVQRLVELEERRDAREVAALLAEQRRLEASAEGEKARLQVELAERQARGQWARDNLGKLMAPVVVLLTALGGVLTAWASGLFGGDK